MQALQNKNSRLVAEKEGLRIRNSQTESHLKASESGSLEKDRKLLVLGREKDEALQLLKARDLELEAMKSAAHKDNIIADFKKFEEFKVVV